MSSLSRIPDSVRYCRYRELVWYCSVHGASVWTEKRPWSRLDSTKTHAQPHYVMYKQVHLHVLRRHTFKTVSKRPCFQFLLRLFTHHTEFGRKTAQSFVIAVEAVWIVKSTTCHLKMDVRWDLCLKQKLPHRCTLQMWWSCLLSKTKQKKKAFSCESCWRTLSRAWGPVKSLWIEKICLQGDNIWEDLSALAQFVESKLQ